MCILLYILKSFQFQQQVGENTIFLCVCVSANLINDDYLIDVCLHHRTTENDGVLTCRF